MQPDTTGGVTNSTASSAQPAQGSTEFLSIRLPYADIVKHIGAQVQSGKLSSDEAKAMKNEMMPKLPRIRSMSAVNAD